MEHSHIEFLAKNYNEMKEKHCMCGAYLIIISSRMIENQKNNMPFYSGGAKNCLLKKNQQVPSHAFPLLAREPLSPCPQPWEARGGGSKTTSVLVSSSNYPQTHSTTAEQRDGCEL